MPCRNVADISGEDKGKRIDVGTLSCSIIGNEVFL